MALNIDTASIAEALRKNVESWTPSVERILSIPVGDALLGRVVNALGEPIDGKGPIAQTRPAASRSRRPASSAASRCTSRCRPASRPSTP
jgi:F-type H+-transporting ATPase subunit alpha